MAPWILLIVRRASNAQRGEKKNIVAFHLIDVIEIQWRNKCPSNQKFIEFNHS